MRRISSPIAFLLLLVLPIQMQMGCSSAMTAMEGYQLVSQLNRAPKTSLRLFGGRAKGARALHGRKRKGAAA